jgi:DNA-binding winged helix-turn-helix (wHTH) protein/tetratricopeptide (TPR) repeat protein
MAGATDPDSILVFGDFRLDTADERLWAAHRPVKLGNKAYGVLKMLAEQQGRLITKDALFSSVWAGTIVSESALTSVIKELRRALGDESRSPQYIESVYGRGYRFIAPVTGGAAAANGAEPRPSDPDSPEAEKPVGRPPLLYVPEFETLGPNDARAHFGPALREEVLFALSRFRDIRLVSDAEGALGQGPFGHRDYQLSVKLLPEGALVRIFARLARLGSGAIIWGETFDLTGDDVGRNVEALVRKIAAAALPRLHDDLLANLPEQPHDLYELYFQTKLRMRRSEGLAEAKAIATTWEEIIEREPTLVQAYPPLIRLYHTDFCFTGLGSSDASTRARAYALAHQAIEIDPTEAHLHAVKGWCHLWARESALAREHFREVLHLNPYNQRRLIEVATGFMFLDELDEAEDLLRRVEELSPLTTEAPHLEWGLLHLLREDYGEAAKCLALVRRHHPDDRAKMEPTTMSELYAALAAAGADAPDRAERFRHWRQSMAERWSRPEPLDDERLQDWALFHNPFQTEARRTWLTRLLRRAMAA